MTQILPTASYLRCQNLRDTQQRTLASLCERHGLQPPEASLRIWELLQTPQTVTTLCRILAEEYALPPQTCVRQVHALLAKLYEEDLIELSADT